MLSSASGPPTKKTTVAKRHVTFSNSDGVTRFTNGKYYKRMQQRHGKLNVHTHMSSYLHDDHASP